MKNDDRPVGHILARREALTLLGLGGAAALLGRVASGQSGPPHRNRTLRGATTNGCFARPDLTEGPYFVDEKLNRSDIRTDPASKIAVPGVPLELNFRVYSFGGGACGALADAMVDIWHCDAIGRYSDVRQNNTAGQKFLRGYQMTDKDGIAKFITIYPGWYRGRAVHIHFKIRTQKANLNYEFTSQVFFDDALSDKIFAQTPYAANGKNETPNSRDGIFRDGGDQLLLKLTPLDNGYSSTFEVGLDV